MAAKDTVVKFTPQTVQQWVATIATVGSMLLAGAGGTYSFLLKTGVIGGKLEKVNMILAEQHIGEEPEQKVVVLDTPNDQQAVYIYENGDTLYYRKYENNDGERQKLKRWTSKKSLDDIILNSALDFDLVDSAKAAEAYAFLDADEQFIGLSPEGYHVFFVESHGDCEFQDPGTGEVVKHEPPPCEQYVVRQKKG